MPPFDPIVRRCLYFLWDWRGELCCSILFFCGTEPLSAKVMVLIFVVTAIRASAGWRGGHAEAAGRGTGRGACGAAPVFIKSQVTLSASRHPIALLAVSTQKAWRQGSDYKIWLLEVVCSLGTLPQPQQ